MAQIRSKILSGSPLSGAEALRLLRQVAQRDLHFAPVQAGRTGSPGQGYAYRWHMGGLLVELAFSSASNRCWLAIIEPASMEIASWPVAFEAGHLLRRALNAGAARS